MSASPASGARPPEVTLAGAILVADAAVAQVLIVLPTLATDQAPLALKLVAAAFFAALAALEVWIGLAILRGRRWRIAVIGVALMLGLSLTTIADPRPLAWTVYGVLGIIGYTIVLAVLVLRRGWFGR